jgi:VWFA-related protein
MTRVDFVATLALAGALASPWGALPPSRPETEQEHVFRAGADAVSVNVFVRDRNRPVAGLGANDFILTDNGVRQIIRSVAVGSMPVDVTVVLDVSGSVAGAALEQFRRDVQDVTAALRPIDRVRVLAYASRVVELRPMMPATDPSPLVTISPGGATAFYNAIVAALAYPSEPGRPHLIVVLGDGGDNVSLLDDRDVLETARRSDAVLHVLIRPGGGAVSGFGWLPFSDPRLDRIRDAADATGGRFDLLKTSEPARALLSRAIDDFKTGYVLWYTPTAVERSGWHAISVRLRSGGHAITARRGYFVSRAAGR